MPVNHSVTQDASPETRNRTCEPARREVRSPSLSLVCAITAGEALLWGTMAWFFADYWMMLPVRYRWTGILILTSLAAVGLTRLILFYRRRLRNQTKQPTS